MKRTQSLIIVGMLSALASSCGKNSDEGTRTYVGSSRSIEFQEPEAAGLPVIELHNPEAEGLALTSCASSDKSCLKEERQKLWDLLLLAGQKIKDGVHSGNNLYAAGASWRNVNAKTVSYCMKVQIQQRKNGKVIVKDTLIPEGQAEGCRQGSLEGVSSATLGIFVKVAGNNYAAGIGVGAVAYKAPYVVGCAAGAVGYASEAYGKSFGQAGAFCTQILDTETGAVY